MSISEQRLYNSRITSSYLNCIREKYEHVNIEELLAYAGMETYQVEDEGFWFTQEQVNRFYEKARELTGSPTIAREAGRQAASSKSLGAMRQYALGLVGPARAYEMMQRLASRVSRSTRYKTRRIRANQVEIVVTPYDGVKERPFQCENRMGFFDAASLIFAKKLPRIEHPECIFKGGTTCRYIITWHQSASGVWKRLAAISAVAALVGIVVVSFVASRSGMATWSMLVGGITAVSLLCLYAQRVEIAELNGAVDNLLSSSKQVIEQIDRACSNAELFNELGEIIIAEVEIDAALKEILQRIHMRLDYESGAVCLVDSDGVSLRLKTAVGLSDARFSELMRTNDTPNDDILALWHHLRSEKRPLFLPEQWRIEQSSPRMELTRVGRFGSTRVVCCPIVYEGRSLGMLLVEPGLQKGGLMQRDLNVLMGVAAQMGLSIHNAGLRSRKERQFRSFMEALAASIDARDSLTAGHSLNVARYELGICEELGLSAEEQEVVRVAALLHDYGKIGVKDSILKKEGPLTSEERQAIETHAVQTRTILTKVDFEGALKQVPEIAGAHHERLDGEGYPQHLKGEDIPIGARIIAVADVFEALTARRHYRGPMSPQKAMEILKKETGTHFDGQAVNALVRFLERTANVS